MASLSISYRDTKNVWMTSDIFTEWFYEDFVSSVKKNPQSLKHTEKALLILDHYPAHPHLLKSKDGKIRVKFLPKNSMELIQPLDQGIIRAFKAYYCHELLSSIVNSEEKMDDFLKATSRFLHIL